MNPLTYYSDVRECTLVTEGATASLGFSEVQNRINILLANITIQLEVCFV
jgi:hypothetical protein